MTIDISTYESNLYSIHYGAQKEEASYTGNYLSSPSELRGNIRGIVDSVTVGATAWEPNEVIFFPNFFEDCYLLDAKLNIETALMGVSTIDLNLYSTNDAQGDIVGTVFYQIPSNTAGLTTEFEDALSKPQGSVACVGRSFLGLLNSGPGAIASGTITLSLQYTATE